MGWKKALKIVVDPANILGMRDTKPPSTTFTPVEDSGPEPVHPTDPPSLGPVVGGERFGTPLDIVGKVIGSFGDTAGDAVDRAPFVGGNILGKFIDRVGDTAGDAPTKGVIVNPINNNHGLEPEITPKNEGLNISFDGSGTDGGAGSGIVVNPNNNNHGLEPEIIPKNEGLNISFDGSSTDGGAETDRSGFSKAVYSAFGPVIDFIENIGEGVGNLIVNVFTFGGIFRGGGDSNASIDPDGGVGVIEGPGLKLWEPPIAEEAESKTPLDTPITRITEKIEEMHRAEEVAHKFPELFEGPKLPEPLPGPLPLQDIRHVAGSVPGDAFDIGHTAIDSVPLPDRAPFGGNILGKVIDRVGDTAGDAVDVGSMAIDSVPLPDRPLFGDKVVKVISAPEITAISTSKQIERADATAERAADTIDVGSMAIDSVPLPDRAPFGGNILGKVIDRVGDTAGDAPNEGLNISINNWLLDHGDTIV